MLCDEYATDSLHVLWCGTFGSCLVSPRLCHVQPVKKSAIHPGCCWNYRALSRSPIHASILVSMQIMLAPGLLGCLNILPDGDNNIAIMFLCLLLFQLLVVSLTIQKAYISWASTYMDSTIDSMLRTLYFDGVIFFICIFNMDLLNMAFALAITDRVALTATFVVPMRILHSVISCRILLNTRRITSQRVHVLLPSPAMRK